MNAKKFEKRDSSDGYDKVVVRYRGEEPKVPSGQGEDLLESIILEERDISDGSLDKSDCRSGKGSLQSINDSEASKETKKVKLVVKKKQFKSIDKLMKIPKY